MITCDAVESDYTKNRQPRRCKTGGKRERGRGRNNSAAAANAARFCEHDDSIDPSFLGTSACLSIQDCITMHHSHTHIHTRNVPLLSAGFNTLSSSPASSLSLVFQIQQLLPVSF